MSRRAVRTLVAIGLAGAGTGCLAEPPGHLPSSIRILYSKTVRDSLGERVDVWFLLAREGNELRLTDGEAGEIEPSFAAGPRRVFYTREEDGRSEIWSMDLGGGDERVELTADLGSVREPDVGPDGAQIAYTRTRGGEGSTVEVATLGSDDGVMTMGAGSWSQPRWSPDGRRLVMVGHQGGVPRLHLVDPATGDARPVSAADQGTAQADPDWSPDGARLVFRLGEGPDAEIAVVAVDGGGQPTILTDNDVEDGSPAFSPSGERVVFVSRRPDGRPNLWVMDADGSAPESLTTLEEGEEAADPDWL